MSLYKGWDSNEKSVTLSTSFFFSQVKSKYSNTLVWRTLGMLLCLNFCSSFSNLFQQRVDSQLSFAIRTATSPKKIAVRKEPLTHIMIENIAYPIVTGAISFPKVRIIREYRVYEQIWKFGVFSQNCIVNSILLSFSSL